MLNLIDNFGGTYIVFPLAIFEMAAVFWVYGKQEKLFPNKFRYAIN